MQKIRPKMKLMYGTSLGSGIITKNANIQVKPKYLEIKLIFKIFDSQTILPVVENEIARIL